MWNSLASFWAVLFALTGGVYPVRLNSFIPNEGENVERQRTDCVIFRWMLQCGMGEI
jgi:hypothetical protein